MNIRQQLVSTALEWQQRFGVAPAITSALSEYDAAILVGCTEEDYSVYMHNMTAVARGKDFVHDGKRYQIKACRPANNEPRARVWHVPKAKNYEWDYLIWIHYTPAYEIYEAWCWNVDDYQSAFDSVNIISPDHMRKGTRLK